MLDLLRGKPDLIIHSEHPLNAEPPLARLGAIFDTPQRDFYLRSHGEVPRLDASHRLRIGGLVAEALDLSMPELRARFPWRRVPAVLQCAGNRRAELAAVRPVTGDPWAPGAIGHAEWGGVSLAAVLRAAGVQEGTGLHVAFEGADEMTEGSRTFGFAVSIPLGKALLPEVILAFEMNGEALAPEHGFPLRVVVPGFAGIRSAKWLRTIEVRDSPADTPVQRESYKLLPPHMTLDTLDWSRGLTIDAMPLNSAICEPARGAELRAGRTALRGYALASGRPVARVDVSGNGGRDWVQAELDARPDSPWSWTLWSAELDLARGDHELVVRAWDSAGQTQPATPDEVWNIKGYLCTAWHRVPVTVS